MSSDSNQYDVLSSPTAEGKSQEGVRSRFSKDDVKEQMFQAKEAIKTKAVDLKEQIVKTGVVAAVQNQLQPAIDMVKERAGLSKDASNEETVDAAKDMAQGEWEEVKRKGGKQLKQVSKQVDAKLNENLTQDQRRQLNKGLKNAKKGAVDLERRAEGWSSSLINSTMRGPALRPIKSFILRNNLQLPAVILGSFISLWLGLSLIRLITSVTTPSVPEFDIHSSENSLAWLKYHAGEYKDKATDMRESLAGRTAAFLANHEFDKLKTNAIDWRDIGMKKLGLHEPTWSEWAWAKVTGRPISWQDRVESVVSLAKDGINRVDLSKGGLFDRFKNMIRTPEPTLGDKIRNVVPGMHPTEQVGIVDGLKNTLQDGYDTIRSKLPGGESVEVLRQRAYDAAHPSTIDQLKSGATYLKNRVIHGAQEAAHIAQDRANEATDKAKYKAGL